LAIVSSGVFLLYTTALQNFPASTSKLLDFLFEIITFSSFVARYETAELLKELVFNLSALSAKLDC